LGAKQLTPHLEVTASNQFAVSAYPTLITKRLHHAQFLLNVVRKQIEEYLDKKTHHRWLLRYYAGAY
jgi:hypothetical protein